ncbi:MAG TPA: DUF1992 domain-containing protein [Burkholderiaceae bacterium]|nr:DUF1992 domain-containing protein [Burkholderiaceae bacterium]
MPDGASEKKRRRRVLTAQFRLPRMAEARMRNLDEEIARHLQEASAAGELQQAPSYGKPLAADVGWEETPEALRMPFKILKDAGVTPPEIEMFHQRAKLRAQLQSEAAGPEREALERKLNDLELAIALRLEALRRTAQG